MAVSIRKPGINITQVVQGTPTIPTTPTLPPCVIGPCFEVMDALVSGAPNPASSVSATYRQLPLTISFNDLPTNHADISDVAVDPRSVSVALVDDAGRRPVRQLSPTAPEAFLAEYNHATRPAFVVDYSRVISRNGNKWPAGNLNVEVNGTLSQIRFTANETVLSILTKFRNAGLDANAKTLGGANDPLFLSYPGSLSSNTAQVIIVSLPPAAATVGADNYIKFFRLGEAVSSFLQKLVGSADGAVDHKVVGSGLKTDTSDFSKIVFSAGSYYRGNLSAPDGEASSESADWSDPNAGGAAGALSAIHPALIADEVSLDSPSAWTGDNIFLRKKYDRSGTRFISDLSVVTSTPLRTGDEVFVNGSSLGVILAASDTFIRVGGIDTASSVYGSSGNIISQRYTPVQLPARLLARNAYLRARSFESVSGSSAASVDFVLTDLDAGYTPAQPASVHLRNASLDTDDELSLQVGGTQLIVTVVSGPDVYESTIPFQDNIETTEDLIAAIVAAEPVGFSVSEHESGKGITLSSLTYGARSSITVASADAGSTATARFHADADAVEPELIGNSVSLSADGLDATLDDLNPAGKRGMIFIDGNPDGFAFTGSSNSVYDLVDDINSAVGATVASFSESNDTLTIESPTLGRTSSISFSDSSAHEVFGSDWDAGSSVGSGRPSPALQVGAGSLTISGSVFRDARTGKPTRRSGALSTPHVSYLGLRKDVSTSPTSGSPSPIIVGSVADITNNFSPISPRNPLALGLFFAVSNAGEGVSVYGIGIDEVNSSEPEGTLAAFARAADLARSQNVYAIAPLTQREDIIGLFDAHVTNMSLPNNRSERVLIAGPKNPTRTPDTSVFTTQSASSVGVVNVIDVAGSVVDPLNASGLDVAENLPIPQSAGVFLSITINGDARRYMVSRVSGTRLTLTTSGIADNGDGFYSTTPVLSSDVFSSTSASVSVRGTPLTISGTNLLNKQLFAETVRDRSQSYSNKRHLRIYPDSVTATIDGSVQTLPSHFAAAALAGDTAVRAPQQPITRASLVGFSNSISPALESGHLDIISAGNAPLLLDGGAVPEFRVQSTTSTDIIEEREFSIVKAVDAFAKRMRDALRFQIGQFNVTQGYIDNLQTIVDSICTSSVEGGLVASAIPTQVRQDVNSPDTIVVTIAVAPLTPANYINVTIVI
jgi:hypothetical protein